MADSMGSLIEDIVIKRLQEGLFILKQTGRHWSRDQGYQMAGSLSFFTLTSLSPVVMAAVAVAGAVFGRDAARGELMGHIETWMGSDAAGLIGSLLARMSGRFNAFWPGVFAVVLMIAGGVVVFVILKKSLNRIWGIETRSGQPFRALFRNRLWSMVMVLGGGLLLLVSIMFGSILRGLHRFLEQRAADLLPLLEWIDGLAVFLVTTAVFAVIYRFLPDARIDWRPVIAASMVTAPLFFLGRIVISRYLGITSRISLFGAAGSLVALLLWVYYSAFIFLLGAEFCQVLHRRYWPGRFKTASYALAVPKPADLISSSEQKNQ